MNCIMTNQSIGKAEKGKSDIFIDLSHSIYDSMPCYPTDPQVRLEQVKCISKNGSNVTGISFGSHTGTHADAPYHVSESGKKLDQLPLSSFYGRAVKLHINRCAEFDPQSCSNGREIDGVILETGWSDHFNDPARYFAKDRPGVPLSLARKLSESNIRFFGCDLPGVDESMVQDKVIHRTFLEKNIVIYENLANLDQLPECIPFLFMAFPLPIRNIDGSPVRAVAMI